MALSHTRIQRSHGRVVPVRRTQRTLMLLGSVALLAIGIVLGALVIGIRSGDDGQETLAIAAQEEIPNREAFGRAWGPVDAPIKIEEFIDYQCPACGAYAREIEPQVMATFAASGKVRYEIHNFQFEGNASQNAAEGAYCAAEQDMFWPMHRSIFLNQPQDHGSSHVYSDAQLVAMVSQLGKDTTAFQTCLKSNTYVQRVEADYDRATSLNINSTPTFLVNGQPFVGVQQVDDFRQIFAAVAPEVTFEP